MANQFSRAKVLLTRACENPICASSLANFFLLNWKSHCYDAVVVALCWADVFSNTNKSLWYLIFRHEWNFLKNEGEWWLSNNPEEPVEWVKAQ